ncbi:MAG: hypothetical protein Q4F00_12290 [bacterium]|nr:hypothetical protein [bacterium]
MSHCPYCGSDQITTIEDELYLEQNCHIRQCRHCQVHFSELEQRLEADKTPLDCQPDCDMSSEDSILTRAAVLMSQNQWNSALELLFVHGYPLEKPLEYLIYRDVCQAASSLQQISILAVGKNYDPLYASNAQLSLLLYNLQHMDYYLPTDDSEKRHDILQRIGIAIYLLSYSAIYTEGLPHTLQDEFINSNIQIRQAIFQCLADIFAQQSDPSHELSYLSSAAVMLQRCLGHERSGTIYVPYNGEHLYVNRQTDKVKAVKLPEEIIVPIEKRLEKMAEEISALKAAAEPDPDPQPLPQPSIISSLISFKSLVFIIIPGLLLIGGLCYLGLYSDSEYSISLIIEILFSILTLILIGILYRYTAKIKKNSKAVKRTEDQKRRQLYSRLYGTNP